MPVVDDDDDDGGAGGAGGGMVHVLFEAMSFSQMDKYVFCTYYIEVYLPRGLLCVPRSFL